MKIAVCVSHVPDTATKIKIGNDAKSIDPTDVTYILNPYDEFAIEEALKTKEKLGGEVVVISLGEETNKESIRKALAMGADNGILLKDSGIRDSLSLSKALAEEIKSQGAQLVFMGKQAVDYDNSITGQLTAEFLGYNCVSVVVNLQIDGENIIAEREVEGGKEVVETSIPAIITCQKGLNEPRYASLKGIMAAKKKVIEEKNAVVFENKSEVVQMNKPLGKQAGKIIGNDSSAVPEASFVERRSKSNLGDNMPNKILVVLEQRDNNIKKISNEVSKAGFELSQKINCEVEAVIIGGEINDLSKIGNFGIGKVTHLKNIELTKYSSSAYTKSIVEIINEINANIILVGNTSLGKDLAPRIAARLDAGIAVDVIKIETSENNIIATRPVYAGKALIDVKINSEKKIFTLRPNVFNPGEPIENNAEIIVKEISSPDLSSKVIEVKKSEGKLDVAEASIIVSGGRGMKEPTNFKLVEELAEVLNAAVGASRAVVDAGWRPHSEQVGQTGKTVSPNLYIALGISGAIQHLAGMRSSKCIVAINKDADAPIFQIADYGIAGDIFEVVPALIAELKK